jgi:hypothetical protein
VRRGTGESMLAVRPMTEELRTLIEANRGRRLSESEIDAQVRSFAYGDLRIEEPGTSRAAVDAAVDAMNEERASGLARVG